MKHCTSKLNSFTDLSSINSFGFRGEALNSLCELSGNFSVSTKQESENVGTVLQFFKNGRYPNCWNILHLCTRIGNLLMKYKACEVAI